MNRRDAMLTGLAALAPTVAKQSTAKQRTAELKKMLDQLPLSDKNDVREERITVLLWALEQECLGMLKDHGAACQCEACEEAGGSLFLARLLGSIFECRLRPFWRWSSMPKAAEVEQVERRLALGNLGRRFLADKVHKED